MSISAQRREEIGLALQRSGVRGHKAGKVLNLIDSVLGNYDRLESTVDGIIQSNPVEPSARITEGAHSTATPAA